MLSVITVSDYIWTRLYIYIYIYIYIYTYIYTADGMTIDMCLCMLLAAICYVLFCNGVLLPGHISTVVHVFVDIMQLQNICVTVHVL